ncbi:acyl transferase/acyl hydrolase/lysophospholipase [Flagelloscypha sp. PMI_526]|nr:acyl transferase/acyl hydrolase/lysophospholipase [Flagelloscypha sp. PMI_526]
MDGQGVRVLVVDGEGSPNIGVISPLEVLQEMMSRIAYDNDTAEESILLCDHFDLIVGSGDGGWIALMLGRLGMSISQAKAAYQEIHSFIHHNCASLEPTAKAEILEVRLKKLVCDQTGEQDPDVEKLQEPKSTKPRCKVAVLTKASLSIGAPIVLRTYPVRDNKTLNCPIWAAMRACTARPNVFPEVLLSGQNLISASLDHNNPVNIAMHEVLAAFPNSRVDCIVSLGAGHPGHSEVQSASSNSLANAAMALAQGSEIVSQEFSKRQYTEGRGDTYFRFNVQHGLQAYVQAGYDSALSHTRAYLRDPAVGDALNATIRALRGERQRDLQVKNSKHSLVRVQFLLYKRFNESHTKSQDSSRKKVTMSSLPDDLLLYLFSMCGARAISRLRQCCKMFYELSHTRIVWLEVLKSTCGELNIAVPPFQENEGTSSSFELLATAWIRFQKVLRNAKDGKPPPHKIVRSIKLTNSVFNVEQSSDGRFLFTIDTGGIRVWNLLSPQPTLVASFKLEIPEEDSWNTITVYLETSTSFLVYLGIIAPSPGVNQWLAFRFQAPSLELGEYQLDLLSRLDRFPFSAQKWCGWTAIPTVPFMTTCFQHSFEGKYYVLWNPLTDTCARWAADTGDTFTDLCIFTISDFIVVLDEANHEIFVYARPEIPPKSSYAPKPFAQINNTALLHIPAETGIMNELYGSSVYWKTFPNRGHKVSNYEGLSFIHDTGEENWIQERFEIYRADSSSSVFAPFPLKYDRSHSQHAAPFPFDTEFVGRTDISIDQSALLHTPSANFTQVAFHLSASPKENGGTELGRGILYDSDGAFRFSVGDYSICPFAGRMSIATPEGIEIIDFVESPYLQDVPTVQVTGKHLPISEVFDDHPGRSRRSSFSISNNPNESSSRTRRNSVN